MSIVQLGFILTLSISFHNCSVFNKEDTLVTLKLGKVQGSIFTTQNGKKVSAFRGIPYAKPPIGQLRFKPPEKLTDPWLSQPFDASKEGPVCIQYNTVRKIIEGQEDCLVLNVYTSEIPNDSRKIDKKAVMVFIHGGGFNFGTAISIFYGPNKLLDHDIVLVTLNYRLSLFGFLSTHDEASPGNYGLLDQVMALKWIQENVEAFGGDPNRVTIFGESAGGACVSYHLLSKLSTGLFKSAIVMSGPSLGFWALDTEPIHRTRKFASLIGCMSSSSMEIVECLKHRSLDEITEVLPKLAEVSSVMFRPVVDGYFLKEHPLISYKSGRIENRVPLIFGKTKNEGIFFYARLFGNSIFELSDEIIKKLITPIYEIDEQNLLEKEVYTLIKNRYFQSVKSTDFQVVRRKLIQIIKEGIIDAPFYYNLEFYLKSGMEPFVYSYDYVTNYSSAKIFGFDEQEPTHADDLYFLFDNQRLFPFHYTKVNDKQEKLFLDFWVEFAKSSNPTPENYENSFKWLPAKNGEIKVCHLDNPITLKKLDIDKEMVDFWMTTLPKKLSNTGNSQFTHEFCSNGVFVINLVCNLVLSILTHIT